MTVLSLVKILQLFVHVLFGLFLVITFPVITKKMRTQFIKSWCLFLLRILKVKVEISGINLRLLRNNFFVANHISWLDIIVINSIMPVVFVAKSSVKSWPIFGLMARFTNTIFLDRSSKTSMLRAYQQIKETLNDSSIFIFPEGTSTVGKHVEPFHSNFFQIPVDLKKSTYPVSIEYFKDNQFTNIPAYVGNDTLVESILRMVRNPGFEVRVTYFNGINSSNKSRKEIALKANEIINTQIAKKLQS
ncbi:MAG: 1-acyl-sn-glycerol-3-phosphate acyltransferase [Betaproteobacteria bacterium]|nr:1-acyl-sn-glycerol-3-phosphate acyltransferase [Betaproteobacteria bacterium]